jgi:hypothetical protein
MSGVYPAVEAAVIAACLVVILFASASIAKDRGLWPAMARGGVGLGWFLVVWELARAGAFEGTRGSARGTEIAAVIVSLAVAWAVLAARRPRPPAADLVAVQAGRAAAVVVLVALAGEALPAWLALPIGLGDSLVALAALSVARGARTATPGTTGQVPVWNLAGALLAAFTIVAPIASARSAGYFFSLYPLVLFPTFLAPCALVLHVLTRTALKRP